MGEIILFLAYIYIDVCTNGGGGGGELLSSLLVTRAKKPYFMHVSSITFHGELFLKVFENSMYVNVKILN